MILGRRTRPDLQRRLAGWFWPRAGWRRTGRYLLGRVSRMPGTPHAIAAGAATGVAVSFTPLLGGHLLLALALAYVLRANLMAAALGTLVGNPWTFPLMLAATYRLGCLMLGLPPRGLGHLAALDFGGLLEDLGLLFWPMLVGSVPLGATAWVAVYLALARAVAAARERRCGRRER